MKFPNKSPVSTGKQRFKLLFTGFQRPSASSKHFYTRNLNAIQMQLLQASSLPNFQRGRGQQLFTKAFQRGGKLKFFSNIVSSKIFPNAHLVIKDLISKEISKETFAGRL